MTGKALPRYTDGIDDPAKGESIPTVKGENFAGDATEISPTTGKAQMVVFLAHWCPHCNREAPRLVAYLKDNGGKPPANVDLTIVPTGSSDKAPNWPPSQWVVQMGLSSLNTLGGRQGPDRGRRVRPERVPVHRDGRLERQGRRAPSRVSSRTASSRSLHRALRGQADPVERVTAPASTTEAVTDGAP